MDGKIDEKKYFTIWGIAIGIRFVIYMYIWLNPLVYHDNYYLFLFIDVLTMIVVVVASVIAMKRCIEAVDEICPGNKKSLNSLLLLLVMVVTLGIYGWIWLKGQLARIEEKCREYKRGIDVKKTLSFYTVWIMFEDILVYYQTFEGTASFSSIDEYRIFMDIIIALCAVTWVLFASFVHNYTSNINELIEANNNNILNMRRQQEENRKLEEEKRIKQEQEIKKLKEREKAEEEEKRKEKEKAETEERIKPGQEKKDCSDQDKREKAEEPVTKIDRSIWHYSMACIEGEYEGMDIPLEEDEFVMMGRNSDTVNIVFTNVSISGLHCQVRYSVDDNCFQVVDFSSYGTFINDNRIEKGELYNCPPESILDLGRTGNRFRLVAERKLSDENC